jgi:Homeodomain-like domain
MPSRNRRWTVDKYRVTLTAEERVGLEQLVSKGKTAACKLTHARILLLADTHGEQVADEDIVDALHTSPRTVARVRHQFVTQSLEAALNRKSQPPRPDKIILKGDLEQKLVQLACSDPPQGRCHWTLQMLADELVVLGLLKTVSVETVRQALKKTISTLGSARRGASRPRPTPSTSGAWKT